jgi:predicted TIM-barrel fold metal-dependent hydrolase
MFGSDYPTMPDERTMREWDELRCSDEVRAKLFHRNAERVLGL